ncbi:hypothetical protein [Chryseobacterium shigense]|uniref:Uncharacterized protein n=1 Tax=Chryseobacterium shigense TaxID=297244 RepID=A0A841NGZ1_9FLAO|nr:hypothetical protein [Chryseobacterium shigense]MBB6371282.1 hypothetical protein [Chryseobacterium shigense]
MGYIVTTGLLVFVIYVGFNPDFNSKLIYKEKCICNKNLSILQYEYRSGSKRTTTTKYAFSIVDQNNNVKNKIKGIRIYNIRYADDSSSVEKPKKSRFYWDCKNRKVLLTKDEFLSF